MGKSTVSERDEPSVGPNWVVSYVRHCIEDQNERQQVRIGEPGEYFYNELTQCPRGYMKWVLPIK